ncbi:MAG TPA: hypothetical protein VHR72_05430, partial [Gemmataceae bacterium]|nr:hypothetical protein [Gemmataceae bacterium]
ALVVASLVVGGILGMCSVFGNKDEEIIGFWCMVFGIGLAIFWFYVIPKMLRLANRLTYYAVTNERILIVSEFLKRSVTSFDLSTFFSLSLTENRNGGGIIRFGESQFGAGAFVLADSAREVYDLIREAQRTAKKGDRSSTSSSLDISIDERIRGERP